MRKREDEREARRKERVSEKVREEERFKEQLESYELEKAALLNRNQEVQGEVKKLASQYGQLLGHQNHKQKIQHLSVQQTPEREEKRGPVQEGSEPPRRAKPLCHGSQNLASKGSYA